MQETYVRSFTAVDIAMQNENQEMFNVLNKVGDKDGILIEEMKQLTLKAKPTLFDNVIRFVKGQQIDISSETRDALLVVAALVATATFQAVLSPPGGLRQADSSDNDSLPFSKVGKVVMKEWLFLIFLVLNGTSFWDDLLADLEFVAWNLLITCFVLCYYVNDITLKFYC
ncbi:hypothetical protein Gotur_027165 [Gossypium turneri]